MNLMHLVRAFQVRGHQMANLDPLGLMPIRGHPQDLELRSYGFSEADLDREFDLGYLQNMKGFLGAERGRVTLRYLYNRLKEAAGTNTYEGYLADEVRQRVDQVDDRLRLKKSLPTVNADLAVEMQQKRRTKPLVPTPSDDSETPLIDNRFQKLFSDKDFQIDRASDEYKALHPAGSTAQNRLQDSDDEMFESVENVNDDDSNDEHDQAGEQRQPSMFEMKSGWDVSNVIGRRKRSSSNGPAKASVSDKLLDENRNAEVAPDEPRPTVGDRESRIGSSSRRGGRQQNGGKKRQRTR